MAYINNDGDILKQPVINWELALEQTGYVNNHEYMTIIIIIFLLFIRGDFEFLQEVLADLITEADEAEETMKVAITPTGIGMLSNILFHFISILDFGKCVLF